MNATSEVQSARRENLALALAELPQPTVALLAWQETAARELKQFVLVTTSGPAHDDYEWQMADGLAAALAAAEDAVSEEEPFVPVAICDLDTGECHTIKLVATITATVSLG